MAEGGIIGALRVVLGMDTATLEDGTKRGISQLQTFGKQVEAIFTGVGLEHLIEKAFEHIVHSIEEGVKEALKFADEMGKMAQKVGIPVEQLTALRVAAELSDVSMESLSKSLGILSKNMVETAKGTGAALEQFKTLGISVADSDGKLKSTTDILAEIADKFHGASDNAIKTAAAMALLGKSGKDLIPLLNEGGDSLKEWAKAAERMGLVVLPETSRQAQEFNDNLKLLTLAKQGLTQLIVAQLLPALVKLSESWVESAKNGNLVRDTADKIVSAIKQVITFGYQAVAANELLGRAFSQLFKAVDDFGRGTAEVFSQLGGAIGVLYEAFKAFWSRVGNLFFSGVPALISSLAPLTSALIDLAVKGFQFVVSLMPKATDESNELSKAWEGLIAVFSSPAFGDAAKSFENFKAILSTFGVVMGEQEEKVKHLFEAIHGGAEKTKNSLDIGDTAFSKELDKLSVQTDVLLGRFNALAPGFAQAAVHLKLTDDAAKGLSTTVEGLTAKQAQLNQALLGIEVGRIAQSVIPEWEKWGQTIAQINAFIPQTAAQASAAAQAAVVAVAKQQAAYAQFASDFVGNIATALKGAAAANKQFAVAAKAVAIASAIVNTYLAATKAYAAYAATPPLAIAAAAAAVAAGLGNVAQIAAQQFAKGGSFKVPGGSSGVDSKFVPLMMAPGEQVDITPASRARRGDGAGATLVTLPSSSLRSILMTGDNLRELVEGLNYAHADGYKLVFAE